MTMVDVRTPAPPHRLPTHGVGAEVAVRNRYLGTWSDGFEIVALLPDGYRIKRASDGAVMAGVIPFKDVREPLGPGTDLRG
jgi:hypothetical protein